MCERVSDVCVVKTQEFAELKMVYYSEGDLLIEGVCWHVRRAFAFVCFLTKLQWKMLSLFKILKLSENFQVYIKKNNISDIEWALLHY